jgi:uncharacterized protein (TIGR03067 family)
MTLRTLGLAAAALALLAPAPDDPTKKDQEKIQGTWNMQTWTGGGKDRPAEEVAKMQLVLKDDQFIPQQGGSPEPGGPSTFKLDATKKPPIIDVTNKNGEVALGIYQLDGDDLKMAFRRPGGKDRPTEFASPADSDVLLLVLKREKK